MLAKIKVKREIARGTLYVVFDLLGERVDFLPGQFFFVTLKDPPYRDQKGDRRHFSIVNSPKETGILAMATRLRDSAFKRSLAELPLGSEVEVGPIAGNFVLPQKTTLPLVFVAGGIGITPFISMLCFLKEETWPNQVTLFYSNKDRVSSAFLTELEAESRENSRFKMIATMTEDKRWPGEKQRLEAALIKRYLASLEGKLFFLAGPPAMVEALSAGLKAIGVPSSFLKTERFLGY